MVCVLCVYSVQEWGWNYLKSVRVCEGDDHGFDRKSVHNKQKKMRLNRKHGVGIYFVYIQNNEKNNMLLMHV